jgi:hypothetical protein
MNQPKSTRNEIVYVITLLLSIYFAGTFWFWPYYVNLFYSLPAGIIAFFLFLNLRKLGYFANRLAIIKFILIAGIIVSAAAALLMSY